jgi:anoctamin-10
VKLTNWENHAHKSTYAASLTLKTFALSAIVAYLGLGLSAFVYVPFGEGVMRWVQAWLFGSTTTGQSFTATLRDMLNGTVATAATAFVTAAPEKILRSEFWDANPTAVQTKLDSGRLRGQMFAYTVTNQAVNTFVEVGLPFVLRRVDEFRKKRTHSKAPSSASSVVSGSDNGAKKRVVFEDEKERGGLVERVFLDRVRQEAALPEYDLFVDYSEMVVQFGYVVLWSTIWPLAAGTSSFSLVCPKTEELDIQSHGIPEQPPRAALRRIQDDGAQPAPSPHPHGYDWTVARRADVPRLARRAHQFSARVPVLAPASP